MKWLLLILTMLVKRFAHIGGAHAHPIEELKDLIKENALKILLAFIAASAIATLFVSGVVLTVINLTAQYDAGFQPRFTASVAGGLGIILASLIVFAIGIYYATASERENKKEEREREKHKEGHSLQEALMLLINDFIQERESKRTHPDTHERHVHDHKKSQEMNNENFRSSEEFERH